MNDDIKQKLTDICARGLRSGAATNGDGQVCAEQAVALACGEPLSDAPTCVANTDRRWATVINDARWPDESTRARVMLPVLLAQLGTAGTDRLPWVKRVAEGTIRKVLPLMIRSLADYTAGSELAAAAYRCEAEGTHESAEGARALLRKRAYVADAADARAHADAAYAAYAAYVAWLAERRAALLAADSDCTAARVRTDAAYTAVRARADDADAAAYAADAATAAADDAVDDAAVADAADAARLAILTCAVQVALDAYAAEGRA